MKEFAENFESILKEENSLTEEMKMSKETEK